MHLLIKGQESNLRNTSPKYGELRVKRGREKGRNAKEKGRKWKEN
jgi:hypothetical protein